MLSPTREPSIVDRVSKQIDSLVEAIARLEAYSNSDKKHYQAVLDMMAADELVVCVAGGQSENQNDKDTIGVMVLTTKRLYYQGSLLMKSASESFPLEWVSSVQGSAGMFLASLKVTVSGGNLEVDSMNKNDAMAMAAAIRSAIEEQPRTEVPQAAASVADELLKLASLRDSGALTDGEFEAQKAKLLG